MVVPSEGIDAHMPCGVQNFIDEMERQVPGCRESIAHFFEVAEKGLAGFRYMTENAPANYFEGTPVAPPKEMDFFTNAIMLWAYVELGAAVPSMKSHEISLACEKTIRDNGGEIWYNTEVKELIEKYAPKGEDYSVFMCGPQAMYNFVDKELEKLHLRRKFIRHELFGEMHNPKEQEEYPKDRTVPETVKITVIQEGEEKTVTGSTDDSLLQILEKNGISAPSHCRSGECGWCHSRLVSGEVYAPTSVDGRREADKKFGYIHPCVSFPLTDMTIEVPNVR